MHLYLVTDNQPVCVPASLLSDDVVVSPVAP